MRARSLCDVWHSLCLSRFQAKKVLEDCLRVDYCRNCRATDMVRFAPEKLCGAAKKERTGFCEAFREEENGGREGLGARKFICLSCLLRVWLGCRALMGRGWVKASGWV